MASRCRMSSLLTCLLLAGANTLVAQDGYAGSVGVVEGDVLVMKADFGQGPASVYVYRPAANGTWELADRLTSEDGASTGEGFSPSMTLSDELLLVGAADAEGRWGARVFRRGASTAWARAESVALIEGEPGAGEWNVAALMQIMQPPARAVATDGDRALVAVVGGPRRMTGVRVFERESGTDAWVERARLERTDIEGNDRFGASLAVSGDVALVGAPEHGASGAVYVFVRDSQSGVWRQEAILSDVDVAAESRFGAMVSFDGSSAVVGIPGTAETQGRVQAYARDAGSGVWTHEGGRSSPDP